MANRWCGAWSKRVILRAGAVRSFSRSSVFCLSNEKKATSEADTRADPIISTTTIGMSSNVWGEKELLLTLANKSNRLAVFKTRDGGSSPSE